MEGYWGHDTSPLASYGLSLLVSTRAHDSAKPPYGDLHRCGSWGRGSNHNNPENHFIDYRVAAHQGRMKKGSFDVLKHFT